MAHYLIESVHKVFEQALGIKVHSIEKPPTQEEDLLYAEIGIMENGKYIKVVIAMSKKGLALLSEIYFGDEDIISDEELEDFLKELSNLVVGTIKSMYSNDNIDAELGTPKILPNPDLDNHTKKYFQVKDSYILVSY